MRKKILILTIAATAVLIGISYGQIRFMGGGHVVQPALPEYVPQAAKLVGWYKIDEGAGSIVKNSSTLVPRLADLTLTGSPSLFWTLVSGSTGFFGSSNPSGGNVRYVQWANSTPCITLEGTIKSRCAFVRIANWPGGFTGRIIWSLCNNTVGVTCGPNRTDNMGLYVGPALASYGVNDISSASSQYATAANLQNKWAFLYCLLDTHIRPRIVLSDGTQVGEVVFAPNIPGATQPVRRINIFGFVDPFTGWTYWDGIIADVAIWDGVFLTVDEYKSFYNGRRGRYGMAAPSGW